MGQKSPLQRVQDEHGSKDKLAGKVLGFLETPDELDSEEFDDRIHKMSNKKLLRLWNYKKMVEDEFGSVGDLIDEIVDAKEGGNEAYREKLESYNLPKIVGIGRKVGVIDD